MPSVPLISARPSLAASSTGVRPAAESASAAGISTPFASRTSPSPISARAQWDRGARSPEQPSEPYSRTTGVMPCDNRDAISCAVSRRTPVCPVARVESRSSISARTTSRSTSGPEPAACERTSDFWSWVRISVGMCRVARAPKPVEMPYDGVSAAANILHDSAGPIDRDERFLGQCDGSAMASDGNDVIERHRPGPDVHDAGSDLYNNFWHDDWHVPIPPPTRATR